MSKTKLPLSVIRGIMTKNISQLFLAGVITITSIFYPYSVSAATLNNTFIGVQKMTPRTDIIGERVKELQKEGYTVVEYSLDKTKIAKPKIFYYYGIDHEEIDKAVLDNLDVIVSCVQVKFDGDDTLYIFKSEEDSTAFLDKVNAIKTQTYSVTNTNLSYSTITSTEVLNQKIEQITTAKQEEEAKQKRLEEEKQKQKTVSSRGSTSSRVQYHSHTFPLASYVYVSSPYGMRNGSMHTGIDFAANAGTDIYAWDSGTVTFAGWSGGYGNFIIVDHGDGFVTRYGHCSSIAVSVGDTVSQGQVIGYVGTTGNSTGNHLHFEIKVNGEFVNPKSYMSI